MEREATKANRENSYISKFGDMTIADALAILEAEPMLRRRERDAEREELRCRADALGHTSNEDGERFQVE